MNALDFGLILRQTNALFTIHPDVLKRHQARVKHVLVDELQDSDTAQYNLHDFFSPPATFFGVGDHRQTVYGFRGARPDLMIDRHLDAEIIDLRDCFRCGKFIVTAANCLIERNNETLAKPLRCAVDNLGLVAWRTGRSKAIGQEVGRLREEGYAWSDIAVLARNHRTLRRLSEVFTEREIPHHRVGSRFEICKTDEFLESLAFLRLIVNKADNLAFMRLVPKLGIARHEWADIRVKAAGEGGSYWVMPHGR